MPCYYAAVEYHSEQIALQVPERHVSDRQDFSLTRGHAFDTVIQVRARRNKD